MPIEEITETKQDFLSQEYVREWRITELSSMKNEVIRIPVVTPINTDVEFCLEIRYQIISESYFNTLSCFKVTLVKLFASEIQPDLKLEFEVTVNYTSGTLFKEYKCLSGISVSEMDFVACIDDISNFYSNPRTSHHLSPHGSAMVSDALVVKLRMKFIGHLSTPSVYCRDMLTLNNLKTFTEDFSKLWKSSGLSDITIQIGGKHLPAHRALLAAHSPVFMKMMDSDFLESKINSISISDFSCDTVECFLKYLYSGEIEDESWSNVRELYILADEYDVQTLKRQCAEIIGYILTVDQVCDILKFAYDYDDSELKKEAKSFAVTHFHEIVHTAEWKALVTSHLIIGYEVSVYFATINVLGNKKPVTLPSSLSEISPEKK